MALVDAVRRLCAVPTPDRVLRARVLAEIGRRIRCDGHVFAMTDPVSAVVSSPHASVPMVPDADLPRLIQRRYACPDPRDWSAWLGREFGVDDVARVCLRDRYGDWGFLELWRTHTRFSDTERTSLASLAPVLTAGLRGAVAGFFTPGAVERSPAEDAGRIEPGVILLDGCLRVRSETDSATAALLRLLPPGQEVPPVPAVAFNVGAALLAERETEPAVAGRPVTTRAWARVHLGEGRLMTARADRIADGIAVSISPCAPAERADLFARAHGLSHREVEVLGLVLRGHGSRAIAASLTIAPTTAEDHLRALLAKTRSRSRQDLLVRALGG